MASKFVAKRTPFGGGITNGTPLPNGAIAEEHVPNFRNPFGMDVRQVAEFRKKIIADTQKSVKKNTATTPAFGRGTPFISSPFGSTHGISKNAKRKAKRYGYEGGQFVENRHEGGRKEATPAAMPEKAQAGQKKRQGRSVTILIQQAEQVLPPTWLLCAVGLVFAIIAIRKSK